MTATPTATATPTFTFTPTPTFTATATNTPLTGLVIIVPGQNFAPVSPGYVGSPIGQEAGNYVTITVRAIEQGAWGIFPVNNTLNISSSEPGFTVTGATQNLAAGEVIFYAQFLSPGLNYRITATDGSGTLGSATSDPVPVFVSPGGVGMTSYLSINVNTAVPGELNLGVMDFTVINPNTVSPYNVIGITMTTSEAVNSIIDSITVSDGSGWSATTTWGNTSSLFVDLYNPSNPTVAQSSSRTYTIAVNIRANAPEGQFVRLSINSEADVLVQKLDGNAVTIYAQGGAYPYNTEIIKIVGTTIATTYVSYPNPFNPSYETASIEYYLPVNARVSLKIYDLISRKVLTFVEGENQAGGILYRYVWDGTNDSGKVVINGVYYGVLTINDSERHITKIAVIK